ncbi:MAG TPA: HAMP domain-containing sensor histidine kinase [Vicinamibacterales bacterium]|nr:HAMP domain-containing sensor histidine kinase [Vicinamibacterales bacterium]
MNRARVIIWYSVALALVLAVFAAIVVWQQGRLGLRRVDRELAAISATLENVLRDEVSETHNAQEAAHEAAMTMSVPNRAIAILNDHGAVLAGDVPASGDWRVSTRAIDIDRFHFTLRVAAPTDEAMRERREVIEAMLIGLPIVLLLAVGGGIWLASAGPLVAQLRDTLQRQRQFMADASHELRTPVSVIQSAADVTLSREERSGAEYRDAVAMIGTEARRLSRLVDDMLVLARADAGGYPLKKEPLYLNELVLDCQRSVAMLGRDRDVRVEASAPDDVPFSGDESLLRRMILNVLQNAVHHTPEHGLVQLDVSPNGKSVDIRVIDQGRGIAAVDRDRIFDRFVQLDAARHGAGAGLGLPIARWIAEAHGGTLSVESTSDAGSTFRIALPLG